MKEYHVHIRVSLANLNPLYDKGVTLKGATLGDYIQDVCVEKPVRGMDHQICYEECDVECVYDGWHDEHRHSTDECAYDVQFNKQMLAGDDPDQYPVEDVANHYPSDEVRESVDYLIEELGGLADRLESANVFDVFIIRQTVAQLKFYRVDIGALVPITIV